MAQQQLLWPPHFGSSVFRKTEWLPVIVGPGTWQSSIAFLAVSWWERRTGLPPSSASAWGFPRSSGVPVAAPAPPSEEWAPGAAGLWGAASAQAALGHGQDCSGPKVAGGFLSGCEAMAAGSGSQPALTLVPGGKSQGHLHLITVPLGTLHHSPFP